MYIVFVLRFFLVLRVRLNIYIYICLAVVQEGNEIPPAVFIDTNLYEYNWEPHFQNGFAIQAIIACTPFYILSLLEGFSVRSHIPQRAFHK